MSSWKAGRFTDASGGAHRTHALSTQEHQEQLSQISLGRTSLPCTAHYDLAVTRARASSEQQALGYSAASTAATPRFAAVPKFPSSHSAPSLKLQASNGQNGASSSGNSSRTFRASSLDPTPRASHTSLDIPHPPLRSTVPRSLSAPFDPEAPQRGTYHTKATTVPNTPLHSTTQPTTPAQPGSHSRSLSASRQLCSRTLERAAKASGGRLELSFDTIDALTGLMNHLTNTHTPQGSASRSYYRRSPDKSVSRRRGVHVHVEAGEVEEDVIGG